MRRKGRKSLKIRKRPLHFASHQPEQMYRKSDQSTITPEKFKLPFEGKLSSENRWVIMAELIPWSEFEEEYAQNFSEKMGLFRFDYAKKKRDQRSWHCVIARQLPKE